MRFRRLSPSAVEKVWGTTQLPAHFSKFQDADRIGELWIDPQPDLPNILAKFLFTRATLSVQVHPTPELAQAGETGTDECWLVLNANPEARIGLGLKEPVSREALHQAAKSGHINELLNWQAVGAGDFFYIPAGTIHAIGGGIDLVEIQQASDTTFRFYDHGRPRALNLERALDVANRTPYNMANHVRALGQSHCLVDGPYFRVDRVLARPLAQQLEAFDCTSMLIGLAGKISVCGESVAPGDCLVVRSVENIEFSRTSNALLVRRN